MVTFFKLSENRLRIQFKDTQEYFHTIARQLMPLKLMINSLKKKKKRKLIQENRLLEKLGQTITSATMITQEPPTGLEPNFWMQ